MFDIVCGGSLYWESTLWQRPHQIISRISKGRKALYIRPVDVALYVKEPDERKKHGLVRQDGLFIYGPLLFPYGGRLKGIRNINNILMIWRVKHFLKKRGFKNILLWLYSPMSGYLIGKLGERLTVYDCMDDHASFRNAACGIRNCEERVFKKSDLVFAGGKSIFEAIKGKNPSTHLFPSAVDSNHFGQAFSGKTAIPDDLKNIAPPVIGYFGAIDERLDYPLIDEMALKNPGWSFVFIGPLRKVLKEELPERKNIYFPGEREYAALPSYIKGFSVGFMPFSLNRHTEKISPTKTLEYLASGCPVVSTPVSDIVSTFSDIVSVSRDSDKLTAQIQALLSRPERRRVIKRGLKTAAENSWDDTVKNMLTLIGSENK